MCNTIPEDENGMPFDINGPEKTVTLIELARKELADWKPFFLDDRTVKTNISTILDMMGKSK